MMILYGIWLFSALAIYVLGVQAGGRQWLWAIIGLLLGPVGMLAGLIVPLARGRYPKSLAKRWTAIGLCFTFLLLVEAAIQYEGMMSFAYRTAMNMK